MRKALRISALFFLLAFSTLFGADELPNKAEPGSGGTKEFILKVVAVVESEIVDGRPQNVLKSLRLHPTDESKFLLIPGDEVTISREGPESFIGEVWTQEFKWERTSGGKNKTKTHYTRKVQNQWLITWGTHLNASFRNRDRAVSLGEALKPVVKFRQKEGMPRPPIHFELAPQVRKVDRPASIPADADPKDNTAPRGVVVQPAFTDGQEVGCVFRVRVIRAVD